MTEIKFLKREGEEMEMQDSFTPEMEENTNITIKGVVSKINGKYFFKDYLTPVNGSYRQIELGVHPITHNSRSDIYNAGTLPSAFINIEDNKDINAVLTYDYKTIKRNTFGPEFLSAFSGYKIQIERWHQISIFELEAA